MGTALFARRPEQLVVDRRSLANSSSAAQKEANLEAQVEFVDKGKYRCRICRKLFRGPECAAAA